MKKSRKPGFTLVEIMIVVAIIGVLAAIAIPSFTRARAKAQAKTCIANLSQIEAAAYQFSIDESKPAGTAITYPNDLTPYLRLNKNNSLPRCPAGGSYTNAIPVVGDVPICSLGTTVTPNHVIP